MQATNNKMAVTFTDDEIYTFLDHVVYTNAFWHLDGTVHRNIEVFKNLAEKMGGEKSGEQWRAKGKNLRSAYLAEKNKAFKIL